MYLRFNCRHDKRHQLGIAQAREAQVCGIEFMCIDNRQELGSSERSQLQPKSIFPKCEDRERVDSYARANVVT